MRLIQTVLWCAVVALPVMGHDPSKHKGTPTTGEIVSINGDHVNVKTASGNVPVTLNEKTKFEHGDQQVGRDHMKKGERVMVYGTKLPSGELVAREILLGAAEKPTHKHK